MKNILLICLVVMIGFAASADRIVTTEADIIDCKVSLIKDNSVVYRKPGEAFDREMERSKILKIKYDNGTEEIMRTMVPPSSNTPKTQKVIPVRRYDGHEMISENMVYDYETEPDWSQFPPASRKYSIGDWYNENGVLGIVIWTTPDGRHGRIVYPKVFTPSSKSKNNLVFFTGPGTELIGMLDYGNGYANWQALKQFIAVNPQYTEDMFPIYQFAQSIGDGWYMPAYNEQLYFNKLSNDKTHYMGSVEKFRGKNVKWDKILKEVAKTHGFNKLYSNGPSVTSTEAWDEGGGNTTFAWMYGDCVDPQYGLLKDLFDLDKDKYVGKPTHKQFAFAKFYLFHLF